MVTADVTSMHADILCDAMFDIELVDWVRSKQYCTWLAHTEYQMAAGKKLRGLVARTYVPTVVHPFPLRLDSVLQMCTDNK